MSRTEQTTLTDDVSVPADYEGQLGNGKDIPTVIESEEDEERCPYCGKWYSRIATHWNQSSTCQWPPVSEYKIELMKGMVLGDGTVDRRDNTNTRVQFSNTNLTFLQWLTESLGWLCHSVYRKESCVEMAQNSRESFGTDTQSKDVFDCYQSHTRTHPITEQFSEWYSTGEIVFPFGLSVSTAVLKMWYASDGGLSWNSCGNCCVQLTSVNEQNRPAQIVGALEEHGFTVRQSGKKFSLLTEDTEDFFELIGEPSAGMEYKWSHQDRERYDRLKDACDRVHKTQTFDE